MCVCRGRRIAPAHEGPRNESNNKAHEPTTGRSTRYGSGHLISTLAERRAGGAPFAAWRLSVTAVVSIGSARAARGLAGLGGRDNSPQGRPTGEVSCAASIAPWLRPPRCARLPQQWPDRAQPGTADRLRPAARAHPARQSAALIPTCSAARGGSCDDCSSLLRARRERPLATARN